MRHSNASLAAALTAIALAAGLSAAGAQDAEPRTAPGMAPSLESRLPAREAAAAMAAQAPAPQPPAAAQDSAQATSSDPKALAVGPCKDRPDTLGVSRVVEVDTTGGPGFGVQYKGHDFLEPGEVVLTFDDGPLRHNTAKVLAALDAECTRATFFSVGKMALADPDMVREIAKRGHTVGTHTWSHRNLHSAAPAAALAELELGVSAVSKALGRPVAPFFRFPYLADSRGMIAHNQSRNLAMFSIDVDALDYRTKDAATVQRRVLAGLKHQGKGIILFHDIQVSTANALPALLAEIRKRGYKVVHLVPKSPAVTVAEYDAIADRELNRKSKAIAANPLANRSVTWANSSAKTTRDDLAAPQRKPAVKPHKTAAVAPPPVAVKPQAPAAAPPPPPPPQRRRVQGEEPWWKGIFGE